MPIRDAQKGPKLYAVLFALFLISGTVSLAALRHNNQTMVGLRQEVYQADKNGTDINKALNNLRVYVYAHMNTDLSSGGNAIKPPIQLKYTYERLQAAEQARVDAVNSKIYTDAENYCQAQIPANLSFSGRARVPCVQNYVSSHGEKPNPVSAGLYEFDFASPAWSPDLAGWSLLATALFFVSSAGSFIHYRWRSK